MAFTEACIVNSGSQFMNSERECETSNIQSPDSPSTESPSSASSGSDIYEELRSYDGVDLGVIGDVDGSEI